MQQRNDKLHVHPTEDQLGCNKGKSLMSPALNFSEQEQQFETPLQLLLTQTFSIINYDVYIEFQLFNLFEMNINNSFLRPKRHVLIVIVVAAIVFTYNDEYEPRGCENHSNNGGRFFAITL